MTSSMETYCITKAGGTTQHSFRALCRQRARTGHLVESSPPHLLEGVARPTCHAAVPLPRFSMQFRRESEFRVSSSPHSTGRTRWIAAERRHLDSFAFRNVAAPRLNPGATGFPALTRLGYVDCAAPRLEDAA